MGSRIAPHSISANHPQSECYTTPMQGNPPITDNRTEHLFSAAVSWQVYIILCTDGSLYTGITTDVERRLRQHAEGKGAKYFRGHQPFKVVYLEGGHNRSSAGRREVQIKLISRTEKLLLLESANNQITHSSY